MKPDTILIIDYGSQYTQLIARRIRELKVYSIISPPTGKIPLSANIKGIILSGGPASVYEKEAPVLLPDIIKLSERLPSSRKVPILGICYGMHLIIRTFGGEVSEAKFREYGRKEMFIDSHKDLFFSLPAKIITWMSHTDMAVKLPADFEIIAHTLNTKIAAISSQKKKIYGVQFHPEVSHTQYGLQIISNFLFRICGCFASWQMEDFIKEKINQIKKTSGRGKVICGLSGGVDSSTAAVLLKKAIGKRLVCIFVDNGLLRKNEARKVKKIFKENFKLNLHCINAADKFLSRLKGVVDPEEKRKIIGEEFIRIFEQEAKKIKGVKFLVQGTLYPDVVESTSPFGGPSAKIKSHHNVGGLPEDMKLSLIEPFRELFKDEVREIARILGIPDEIIHRHPFPGPGLAVRILGEVNKTRLKILREADFILEKTIKEANIYEKIWQSFCVLLPLRTVGVMGDKRTYEYVVAIRAVESIDGMTADWVRLPYSVLSRAANRIVSSVRGVNRVVFDITSKPPSTIEWE